eukprot:143683_1
MSSLYDYLNLQNSNLSKIRLENNEHIILSTQLFEICKKEKLKKCVLLCTNKALYHCRQKSSKKINKCQQKVNLKDILSITVSQISEEFVVLLTNEDYIRYKSPYNDIIVNAFNYIKNDSSFTFVVHKIQHTNIQEVISQQYKIYHSLVTTAENSSEDEKYNITSYKLKNDSELDHNGVKTFILTWQHISNAIKHALYDNVASSFMVIINDFQRKSKSNAFKSVSTENINLVLKALQQQNKLNPHELDYINKIIESARKFEPVTNAASKVKLETDNVKEMSIDEDVIDDRFVGLHFNTINDIYNVHDCFIFSNYHFSRYEKSVFIDNIQENNFFKQDGDNEQFIDKVKNFTNTNMMSIDLFPVYVIEDDMYQIWNYFFKLSHLAYNLKETKSNLKNNVTLKMVIIPKMVVSKFNDEDIYTPKLIVSDYDDKDIFNVKEYLQSNSSNAVLNYNPDPKLLFSELSQLIANNKNDNVLVVIDRRFTSNNVYVTTTNVDLCENYPELNTNYFISLQLQIFYDHKVTKCYLFYGKTKNDKLRFYPEHLTTIVPRFFAKDYEANHFDTVNKLYADNYKHGLCVDLNDPVFNKYYKAITGSTHVSVNYNRNVVKEDEKKYEYNDSNYDEIYAMNKHCDSVRRLQMNECPFIQYIIQSLIIYTDSNLNINAIKTNEINLERLTACYDHLICTHSFCTNIESREKIRKYIHSKTEKCGMKERCQVIRQHATRTRENMKTTKTAETFYFENKKILSNDLLTACLNSLHAYLLHDADQLFRLRRNDYTEEKSEDSSLRFTSNPLQFVDQMD